MIPPPSPSPHPNPSDQKRLLFAPVIAFSTNRLPLPVAAGIVIAGGKDHHPIAILSA